MVDVVLDAADALEIDVGEDRRPHLEPLVPGRPLRREQVGPRTDQGDQRHHQLLADRIDRRVGDLGEALLEVVVEHLRPVGEDGDRNVAAHRADRILAGQPHRLQEEADVFLRVAERLLPVEQRLRIGRHRADLGRQLLDADLGRVQPLLVRPGRGELLLELGIVDDPTLLQVDQEHLARLQSPLLDDLVLGDLEDARLRRHHAEVVLGDDVAGRPQPVAVEGGADQPAVGKRQRRRAVPRLHQRRVILVEGAPPLVHQRIVVPRLGNHHHHRVRQRVAAGQEQLERVVERRRVRSAVADQGPQLLQIILRAGPTSSDGGAPASS